ncbi:MAG: 4-alpha-glucanotransferase [Anaerolineales bacterium]|nr:4-alpha-glucanotransferase [Anaerolineales bacterium]
MKFLGTTISKPRGFLMNFERTSGILLHPTSLPGPYGIGDLGAEAYAWIDFVSESGCGIWQILPLGPTGYGDSPYQCFSAFAGNPYLISLGKLLEGGLLTESDLEDMPDFNPQEVDFGQLIPWKLGVLDKAFKRFEKQSDLQTEYATFQEAQARWLEDFALFMALKDAHGGRPWSDWDMPLRMREDRAIAEARQSYAEEVEKQKFRQFIFFRQWEQIRAYCHQKNVQIVGDIPIYVSHDSTDVWVRPDLYYMDDEGQPTVVAGVPPDYFSKTGQLWGNPIYRWDVHAKNGYAWWLARLRSVLSLVDVIRLDHFRGFAGYWEIPAGNETAEEGRWVKGPGDDFFQTVRKALGELPLIAEDLGEITPDVFEMRDKFELPGMKILQFGFADGPDDPFLPHMYPENCVAYTGTHDNDTVVGWFDSATPHEREFCLRYLGVTGEDIAWDMIRALWASRANVVVAPLQDFLSLGTEARMNFPSTLGGNWQWRTTNGALSDGLKQKIASLNKDYDRYMG